MSQNPKKSLQRVELLSLQKTKRMNFSAEVAPEAILRLSWEGPESVLGLILAISVVFWYRFERHSIAQSTPKIWQKIKTTIAASLLPAPQPQVRLSRASVLNPSPLWPASLGPLSTPDHTWEGLALPYPPTGHRVSAFWLPVSFT